MAYDRFPFAGGECAVASMNTEIIEALAHELRDPLCHPHVEGEDRDNWRTVLRAEVLKRGGGPRVKRESAVRPEAPRPPGVAEREADGVPTAEAVRAHCPREKTRKAFTGKLQALLRRETRDVGLFGRIHLTDVIELEVVDGVIVSVKPA